MREKQAMKIAVFILGLLLASPAYSEWNFGQGLIDKISGKESEAEKFADKEIQGGIDKIGASIEKVNKKISDTWNKWREDKIDPIGSYITDAYKYLKASGKGNPEGFPAQAKQPLLNPDIQVVINNRLTTKLLSHFISEKIPLDKDEPNNENYFYFDEASFSNDGSRRVVKLKIAKGKFKFKFVAKNSLKIREAKLEIFPKIRKTDNKFFLDFNSRMTWLDIENLAPVVERGIAHAINDHMKKKDVSNGFMSIDLTEKSELLIKMSTLDNDSIKISLSEACVYIEGSAMIYEAKFSVDKQ